MFGEKKLHIFAQNATEKNAHTHTHQKRVEDTSSGKNGWRSQNHNIEHACDEEEMHIQVYSSLSVYLCG